MPADVFPKAVIVPGHGDVPINVWDYGGSGAPLLLLHCTGTLGRVWDPVAALLTPHFHVMAPDARGHGQSGKPDEREDYRWEHSGRDLLCVMDALVPGEECLAVGHSGGGACAAYAELFRPGTFRRTVLIDPIIAPAIAFSGETDLAKSARRRRTHFESRAFARERFAARPPMRSWCAAALDAYVNYGLVDCSDGQVALACPRHVEAWLYELGGAHDVFDRLAELQFETLLVTGSRSDIKPLAELQFPRFSRASFHCIEGAGHFIPQEVPETLAALIMAWLGECLSASKGA